MRTTLAGATKIDAVNTGRDGSGSVVAVGEIATGAWAENVSWQSLGDNAVCVGRLFALEPGGATYLMLPETTLAAVSSSSQTAKIAPVDTNIQRWFAAGTKFVAAVSVDLTGSTGYQVSLNLGDHRRDFSAD